jgi:hypothetical protein
MCFNTYLCQFSLYYTQRTGSRKNRGAAALNWDDFEDALQSVTAERIHADYIITRNVRDFSDSRIMAFTPAELLARI